MTHNAKRKIVKRGAQRDLALRAMFWTATGMSPLLGSLRSQVLQPAQRWKNLSALMTHGSFGETSNEL